MVNNLYTTLYCLGQQMKLDLFMGLLSMPILKEVLQFYWCPSCAQLYLPCPKSLALIGLMAMECAQRGLSSSGVILNDHVEGQRTWRYAHGLTRVNWGGALQNCYVHIYIYIVWCFCLFVIDTTPKPRTRCALCATGKPPVMGVS